jgi:TRAP-type C4-dicarboxylate transport system permease small subunit
MLLATGGQVLFRYVLKIAVPWTEELARALFVMSMFLGMAIAIRGKEHIVVDFLFKKFGARKQAFGRIVFDVAILILLCFLVRGTITMTRLMWDSYLISLDWIRTGYLYIGELLAVLLMMFYVVQEILQDLRTLRTREGEHAEEGQL